MPASKHPHGTTLHQAIVLAIIEDQGPMTSGELATRYRERTAIEVAYNYQYILTRRMADRGLIRSVGGKRSAVYRWRITAAGKRVLNESRRLADLLSRPDATAVAPSADTAKA